MERKPGNLCCLKMEDWRIHWNNQPKEKEAPPFNYDVALDE